MKKEIKDKWVRALELGEYEQEQGYLRRANKFCCLGVLCDLYSKEEGISTKWEPRNERHQIYEFSNAACILPQDVQDWAGMNSGCGYIKSMNFDLGGLNDQGKTFKEIATVIRDNWKEL